MALRIHVYVGLLHQDLVARGEIGFGARLPAVLPIVLYNGQAPWRSSLSLDALLLEWLSGEEHQRLRRGFAIWLPRRAALRRGFTGDPAAHRCG